MSLSHVAASSRHMGVGRAQEVATGPVLTDVVVVIVVVLCVLRWRWLASRPSMFGA